jgi:AmmeMemoRadiSam system protein B/AmmeMemoRadiSam system protein A
MRYILIAIILLALASPAFCLDIKNADLAGNWYPSNAKVLKEKIDNYLAKANPPAIAGDILAIICPHAGLQFSGPIAAYGFKAVQKKPIDTVIVVGFSHRKDYNGIAIFSQDGIKTPLGTLYTDRALSEKLMQSNKKIFTRPDAFKEENSIELILPFIQVSLSKPKVVLLIIGNQTLENCEMLGASLAEVLKDKNNFLMIASTDMSHYLSDEQAKKIDANTARLVEEFKPEKLYLACYADNRMCGLGAVSSVMIAAKKLGANKAIILKQGTSGDVTWDKRGVVGYLSAAFIKQSLNSTETKKMDQMLNDQQRKKLLKIARDTITLYVTTGKILEVKETDPVLNQTMGAFVTLGKQTGLRGCIGNFNVHTPLYLTVRDMAIAAATQDPRFNPVTADELKDIHIEISALSPLKKIANPDEIVIGKHGVMVKDLWRSGVYLPQVATETGWTKEQFMNSLCAHKAGMNADAWKTGKCELYIFSAEVFAE